MKTIIKQLKKINKQSYRCFIFLLILFVFSCNSSASSESRVNPFVIETRTTSKELNYSASFIYGKVMLVDERVSEESRDNFIIIDANMINSDAPSNAISTETNGTINVAPGLELGTYTFQINVTTIAGENFSLAGSFTIEPITISPSDFSVSPISVTKDFYHTDNVYGNITLNSGVMVSGFTIVNIEPMNEKINITEDGIIQVAPGSEEGNYTFQIEVTGTGNYRGSALSAELFLTIEPPPFLYNVFNISQNLTNPNDIATVVINNTTYLFVVGFNNSNLTDPEEINIFRVESGGRLTFVNRFLDTPATYIKGAIGIDTVMVEGTRYFLVAGFLDIGMSVFALENDFSLRNTYSVIDDDNLQLRGVGASTTAVVDGKTYFFVASQGGIARYDNGISGFEVLADGTLRNVFNVTERAGTQLNGISNMTTKQIGSSIYLFITENNGVNVFEVTSDGTLRYLSRFSNSANFPLGGANEMTIAELGGKTYLFVVKNRDDGVSVFEVLADGALRNTDNVLDSKDNQLKIEGARGLHVAELGGKTYLFVTGFDEDGLSAFEVFPDGTLSNVANINDLPSYELDGADQVTTAIIDGTPYLLVAGNLDNGISVFLITPPE